MRAKKDPPKNFRALTVTFESQYEVEWLMGLVELALARDSCDDFASYIKGVVIHQ